MKKTKRIRSKILLLFIPLFILTVVIISYYFRINTKKFLLEEFDFTRKQTENEIITSVRNIDSAYRMLEKKLNEDLNERIETFIAEYQKNDKNIDKINLNKVRNDLGGNYDLYIIDETTTVVKTTDKVAQGFNFLKFNKPLGKAINEIRVGNEIANERLRTNITTGFISTWVYKPTSDHKYVFEIGYRADELQDLVMELDPLKVTKKLIQINPVIEGIRIFDIFGMQFVSTGKNYQATPESKEIVELAKSQKRFSGKSENGKDLSYLFIDLSQGDNTISDHSKVVEITYNLDIINKRLKTLNYFSLAAGFFFIAVLALIIFFISKQITNPIENLNVLSHKMIKGNYSVEVSVNSNDEIGEFAATFNKMAKEIQRNFSKIARQKRAIEDYSRNLEDKVEKRTIEIKSKNSQIMASFGYASKIQHSMLPQSKILKELFKDFFIYWQPRDVVSGDFYWTSQTQNFIFLAVVDCTGHGVPGAFLSMIGNMLLNRIVNENKNENPAKILELLDTGVINALKQNNYNKARYSNDGMDISLCRIDKKSNRLTFAGAKQAIFVVKKQTNSSENNYSKITNANSLSPLIELKGNNFSIGGKPRKRKKSFTNRELILDSGDLLFLFSDGYIDQNNYKNKKIGSLKLKQNLIKIANKELYVQKKLLIKLLNQHKGPEEQRDDITLFAIRI